MATVCAIIIFLAMFGVIIRGRVERHIPALVGGALVLIVVFGICMHSMDAIIETLNFKSIFTSQFWVPGHHAEESATGINWATIIFIAGMMLMVEGMGDAGFFRWLCLKLAQIVNYKIIPLFISFMIMSAVLSMFIDSITVILFLAAVSVELAKILKFDPVPIILAEIFMSNVGGSATMSGDPPNIIIGTGLGYTFFDFLTNTGLIAFVSGIVLLLYFYLVCRKELKASEANRPTDIVYPNPSEAITNKLYFIVSCIIFFICVVLLVTHAQTGLSVASIGVIAAILSVIASVIIESPKKALSIIKRLDYTTILFFIGLFVVVGGLEQTGVLEYIAKFIEKISGGSLIPMIIIILWVSAIASAFVDNIPFAATMVPVIKGLATSDPMLRTLAWTLAIGTDIGGNGTPIGASANVVGTSIAAREGHPISWKKYCSVAAPATILTLLIATIMLIVRYAI
ncbi:MAG: SLC13 family permease [Clostridiales bacterium]|nr:SLC13 family permease [Clostridiales bacterium]